MLEPLKKDSGADIPDKDTQEIIDGMRKDGIRPPHEAGQGDDPDKGKKPDGEAPPAPKPDEPKGGEEEKGKKGDEGRKVVEPQSQRSPVLIPYSKHKEILENEKKKWRDDEVELLRGEITTLTKRLETRPDTDKGKEQQDDDIKQFAEEHQLDEKVVTELLGLVTKRLPKNEPDPDVEALKAEREQQKQETLFNTDFQQHIVPLIKAEHPNATPEEIEKIHASMLEKAFSEELLKTPLTLIYKGEDEFRTAVAKPGKRSSEPSKGGSQQGVKSVDYDNVTAEDIAGMTDEEFDKYSEEMGRRHKSPLRRGGRIVK